MPYLALKKNLKRGGRKWKKMEKKGWGFGY
jgi:hypothetical protein